MPIATVVVAIFLLMAAQDATADFSPPPGVFIRAIAQLQSARMQLLASGEHISKEDKRISDDLAVALARTRSELLHLSELERYITSLRTAPDMNPAAAALERELRSTRARVCDLRLPLATHAANDLASGALRLRADTARNALSTACELLRGPLAPTSLS